MILKKLEGLNYHSQPNISEIKDQDESYASDIIDRFKLVFSDKNGIVHTEDPVIDNNESPLFVYKKEENVFIINKGIAVTPSGKIVRLLNDVDNFSTQTSDPDSVHVVLIKYEQKYTGELNDEGILIPETKLNSFNEAKPFSTQDKTEPSEYLIEDPETSEIKTEEGILKSLLLQDFLELTNEEKEDLVVLAIISYFRDESTEINIPILGDTYKTIQTQGPLQWIGKFVDFTQGDEQKWGSEPWLAIYGTASLFQGILIEGTSSTKLYGALFKYYYDAANNKYQIKLYSDIERSTEVAQSIIDIPDNLQFDLNEVGGSGITGKITFSDLSIYPDLTSPLLGYEIVGVYPDDDELYFNVISPAETGHDFETGNAVELIGTNLPYPLEQNTTYYAIHDPFLDPFKLKVKVATSLLNALNNIPINIENTGSGTNSIRLIRDTGSNISDYMHEFFEIDLENIEIDHEVTDQTNVKIGEQSINESYTKSNVDTTKTFYAFNRPWFSVDDASHNTKGTGIETKTNVHAISFDDLTGDGLSFHDRIISDGIIIAKAQSTQSIPGKKIIDAITPDQIKVDFDGNITTRSVFGGPKSKYILLDGYPYQVRSVQDENNVIVPSDWIIGTNIIVFKHMDIPQNIYVEYFDVSALSIKDVKQATTIVFNNPEKEVILSNGKTIKNDSVNTEVDFKDVGDVPNTYKVFISELGKYVKSPQVIGFEKIKTIGLNQQTVDEELLTSSRIKVGLSNTSRLRDFSPITSPIDVTNSDKYYGRFRAICTVVQRDSNDVLSESLPNKLGYVEFSNLEDEVVEENPDLIIEADKNTLEKETTESFYVSNSKVISEEGLNIDLNFTKTVAESGFTESDEKIKLTDNVFEDKDEVYLETTSSLPPPLKIDTPYYIKEIPHIDLYGLSVDIEDLENDEFVSLTGKGTGRHTIKRNVRFKITLEKGSIKKTLYEGSLTDETLNINEDILDFEGVSTSGYWYLKITNYTTDETLKLKDYTVSFKTVESDNPVGVNLKLSNFSLPVPITKHIFPSRNNGQIPDKKVECEFYTDIVNDLLDLEEPNGLFFTGDAVLINPTSGGSPDPLVDGVTYYTIATENPLQVRLAETEEDAHLNNYIDLISEGPYHNEIVSYKPDELKNSFEVVKSGNISDQGVRVKLVINHPSPEDLQVKLKSPDETEVTIYNGESDGVSGKQLIINKKITNWNYKDIKGKWEWTVKDIFYGNKGTFDFYEVTMYTSDVNFRWYITENLEKEDTDENIYKKIRDTRDNYYFGNYNSEKIEPNSTLINTTNVEESARINYKGTRIYVYLDCHNAGDLVITLTSPEGTEVLLHNRENEGESYLYIDKLVEDFKDEEIKGDWILTIQNFGSGEGELWNFFVDTYVDKTDFTIYSFYNKSDPIIDLSNPFIVKVVVYGISPQGETISEELEFNETNFYESVDGKEIPEQFRVTENIFSSLGIWNISERLNDGNGNIIVLAEFLKGGNRLCPVTKIEWDGDSIENIFDIRHAVTFLREFSRTNDLKIISEGIEMTSTLKDLIVGGKSPTQIN